MSRPHPSAFKYTAKNKCVWIYGVFEREKQSNDIPEVREYEICISESGVLVQRILRGHSRENTKAIKAYIADQLKRDRDADQLSIYDPRDPFTGSK